MKEASTRKYRQMTNQLTTPRREKHALRLTAAIGLTMALSAACAHAADTRKETRLDIAAGGTVTIVNNTGSVTLHFHGGRHGLGAYTTHSHKVEVDENTTPHRQPIHIRTHT